MDLESTVMNLIINAGDAKSAAMQALVAAKSGAWDEVDAKMAEASEASRKAHEIQTELIGMDEGEGKLPVNLIMVHAQDHIMTSLLARELIAELISIHRLLQKNGAA